MPRSHGERPYASCSARKWTTGVGRRELNPDQSHQHPERNERRVNLDMNPAISLE